jgi:glycerophosphoryl diester phosphodiesterase
MILQFTRDIKMLTRFLVVLALLCDYSICQAQISPTVFAHRGFRGIMPENTIQAMKNALNFTSCLELDLAFSKDGNLVVSHDPTLDSLITLDKNGNSIKGNLAIYQLNYEDIRKYDVGTKVNPKFKNQKNFKAYIPLFSELIDSVELEVKKRNLSAPVYFVETKTKPAWDGTYHPDVAIFVDELVKVIKEKGVEDRIIVQSFDPRTLEVLHKKHPHIKTALLTNSGTLKENLNKLSFQPNYYCPAVKLINKELVTICEQKGIQLLGGNVNNTAEIKRILALGVKGFISDYPYPDILK